MSVALVTGSAGLVGSETVRIFHAKGWDVIGIDNDMRSYFFGGEASTASNLSKLQSQFKRYTHVSADIRDTRNIDRIFCDAGRSIGAVIHAAAQPSHDWAAREPHTDFGVNAVGTLNLLEATRKHAPDAAFVFVSTNKVYGDTPNRLPLIEADTRYTIRPDHAYAERGIDETMSIDQSVHSVFGASKVAADILVQEYGRYFGMNTVCFRCGCLTGPAHAGAELHGFLAFLVDCCVRGRPYTVFGHKAKQVRDNLHAADLVEAFWRFVEKPQQGAVYNMGGGTVSNCSMLEAIRLTEEIVGRSLDWRYSEANRTGDHIWWISDLGKFRQDYPEWNVRRDVASIITEIANRDAPA